MIQHQRRTWARPGIILTAVATVTSAVVALSFVVQPPAAAGSDSLLGSLAWGRSLVFSIGIISFVVGLAGVSNADEGRAAPQAPIVVSPAARASGDGFTVVALGAAPDDARAIDEATDATDAVRLVHAWREERPGERIVVYGADGRPLAFRRPRRTATRARRRRAA